MTLIFQDAPVEPHVGGLTAAIQFLAQAIARARHPPPLDLSSRRSGGNLKLREVGFDRHTHVGLLELAGQPPAVTANRPMNLTEGRGSHRVVLEAGISALPIGTQFTDRAALDEVPPHGRRVGLQLR